MLPTQITDTEKSDASAKPSRTAAEICRDWEKSGAIKTSAYFRLLSASLNEKSNGGGK